MIKRFRNMAIAAFVAVAGLVALAPQAQAASVVYDSFLHDLMQGNVNPSTDTVKCMLVTSSYTVSKSAHAKRSDITNEVSGTGYTAGGVTATVTLTAASGNSDKEVINISGLSWSTATITAAGVVCYKSRGGASSADNLYFFGDLGGNVTSTASTFSVTYTAPFSIQN